MTNDNEQIRLALRGDDGSAVRKCEGPRCVPRYDGCPICNGFGWIENRELIADAICLGPELSVGRHEDELHDIYDKGDEHWFMVVWDNRHGKDYQSALEAHVLGEVCQLCAIDQANFPDKTLAEIGIDCECNDGRIGGWREPAPAYDSEAGMVLLKAALTTAGWFVNTELGPNEALVHVFDNYEGFAKASVAALTEHEALHAATVAAIGGSDGVD